MSRLLRYKNQNMKCPNKIFKCTPDIHVFSHHLTLKVNTIPINNMLRITTPSSYLPVMFLSQNLFKITSCHQPRRPQMKRTTRDYGGHNKKCNQPPQHHQRHHSPRALRAMRNSEQNCTFRLDQTPEVPRYHNTRRHTANQRERQHMTSDQNPI